MLYLFSLFHASLTFFLNNIVCRFVILIVLNSFIIQGDFESCADILITSYWLYVELGKNV
jgi:hypothetical protein